MKISTNDLTELLFAAYKNGFTAGDTGGYQRAQDSIRALVNENSQLKTELATLEVRSATRVMAAGQQASFPTVRAEQQRIVKGIRQFYGTDDCEGLLLSLALGDIG